MATLVYFRALHNTYGRNLKSPFKWAGGNSCKGFAMFLDKGIIFTKKTKVKTKSPAEKEVFFMTHLMIFFSPNNIRDGGSTTL